jgi:hypothetical protein
MSISGIWQPGRSLEGKAFDFKWGGLGLVLGPHVRRFEDEQRILFLDGHFYDQPSEKGLLDISILERAFGYFAYVRIEKGTGNIDIGTDWMGLFPLYYAEEDGRVIFGTTLDFVKSNMRNPAVNYEAWEELFVLGDVIGDKSVVKGAERLRYGTRIQLDSKIRLVHFWKPEQPDLIDDKAYVIKSNQLLNEALAFTAQETRPKVVLLSGGEDSRRIALSAVKAGLNVSFRTQEVSHQGGFDIDTPLARKVAKALDRPFESVPLPDAEQYVADWHERNELLGFECTAHEWILPLVRSTKPASIIYDGLHGGVLNGHYFKEFPQSVETYDVDSLAGMICAKGGSSWIKHVSDRATDSLFSRVKDILSRYPNSPNRTNWFFTLHHTRRKIAFFAQLFARNGHWICYPFTYYPLLMHSYSLDPRQERDRFFQRECMAAISPEIAQIPTSRGAIPPEYLTSMTGSDREQRRVLRRSLEISDDALELFPEFRARYRVLNRVRRIAGGALPDRYGWFLEPISRFSSFLDWLKDKKCAVI